MVVGLFCMFVLVKYVWFFTDRKRSDPHCEYQALYNYKIVFNCVKFAIQGEKETMKPN